LNALAKGEDSNGTTEAVTGTASRCSRKRNSGTSRSAARAETFISGGASGIIVQLVKVTESPYITEQRSSAMTSTVTAAAVSKNFGAYQDAAVREPVIITKNGRPRTVLMAYEDYIRLAKRDRRVDLTATLSDEDLALVDASSMEAGLEHLNDELTTDNNAAR
jgi:prevent-host-death family protein